MGDDSPTATERLALRCSRATRRHFGRWIGQFWDFIISFLFLLLLFRTKDWVFVCIFASVLIGEVDRDSPSLGCPGSLVRSLTAGYSSSNRSICLILDFRRKSPARAGVCGRTWLLLGIDVSELGVHCYSSHHISHTRVVITGLDIVCWVEEVGWDFLGLALEELFGRFEG